jgi:hypothetical protein
MNSFMNALWNANGSVVTGVYNDQPFYGHIESVRTKAGTDLSVTVKTEQGETILLTGSELFQGEGKVSKNLHVYF